MNESKSIREELLAVLWAIAAILCFGFGFTTWGWIFGVKAGLDFVVAIYFSIVEVRIKHAAAKKKTKTP